MALIEVGQHAPSFRLPSGQGPERGLDDYRGRSHVILWFTKGMGCPFCRSQMSQLARGYERNFNLPFVYLCDPDYSVHRQWGVDGRSHGPGWYAQRLYTAMKMTPPQSDLGDPRPTLGEMHSNLADTDMGLFLIDRAGVVRWVVTGAYGGPQGVRGIPSTEEIVRELERAAA